MSYSKHGLADIFAQVGNTPSSSSTSSSLTTLSVAEIQSIFGEKEKNDLNWAVDKVSRRKDAKYCTCQERLQKQRSFCLQKAIIFYQTKLLQLKEHSICLTKSFALRKPFLSTIAVPPQSVNNASFATLKISISSVNAALIFFKMFFYVLSCFCSFLFLIRNICDRRDSVSF